MRWLSVLVCGILVIGFVHGCGARVEVAKARVKERIDSLLGTLDVKRKEIEIGMKGLTKGINGLRRAKIKAQVSGEQIGRQAKPHEGKLASMDVALKTLRGHLEAAGPVEIAGRNYSPQEIHDMTERVLQARKATAAQVEAFHESQSRLAKVVSTLERKQQDAVTRLTQIEGQLAVIDSNRIALTAMQQSAEAMGGDANLAKSLDHLQDKVNDLFASVEVELRCEDAKWAETEAVAKEVDAVEATLALQDSHDTLAEIDKILGK